MEYAAPNYLLKEKITLKSNEWREIKVKDILKQKLITNKRSSDCDGYVIAQAGNTSNKNSNMDNISYKSYIKCKKLYTTEGYGTKGSKTNQNVQKTQTQKDTEKPKITLFGDEKITLSVGDTYKEQGAMAIDNIDGDITKKIKITGKVDTTKLGTYEVKYTVTDSSKNKASITRTIIVKESDGSNKNNNGKDTTKPQIEFSNPSAYQRICQGSKVDISTSGLYGFVARDDKDGDITSSVKISGSTGTINTIGTYSLTYEVSDKAGNITTTQRNFDVVSCKKETPTPTPVPTPSPTPTPTPAPAPNPVNPLPNTDTVIPVTSVTLTPNTLTLSVGNTYHLSVSLVGSNGKEPTNKAVTYSSSNPGVVSVDSSGNVRGLSKGSATIRATSNNGKVGVSNITVK